MMWHIFFDASALVKRYSLESGAVLVDEAFRLVTGKRLFISALGILEVASILRRKNNDGRLPKAIYKQVIAEFHHEIIDSGEVLTTNTDNKLLLSALGLISAHNINASDGVILRSALNVRGKLQTQGDDLMLWTSDKRLVRAAIAEGLTVFDPEVDTIVHLHQLLGITDSSNSPE